MPEVSAMLANVSNALAREIERGDYAALTPEQRSDLRLLPVALAALGERARDVEVDLVIARMQLRFLAARGRVGDAVFFGLGMVLAYAVVSARAALVGG